MDLAGNSFEKKEPLNKERKRLDPSEKEYRIPKKNSCYIAPIIQDSVSGQRAAGRQRA